MDEEPDGEAAILASTAFKAACIPSCELILNELKLKLPNCDNEFKAFSVAVVAALFPAEPSALLLLLLLDRGDSFGKLVWCDEDDVDELEWFGNDDPEPKPLGIWYAELDDDSDDECLLFDWFDFFDEEVDVELFPNALVAACIANSSLCRAAGLYWFDDDL